MHILLANQAYASIFDNNNKKKRLVLKKKFENKKMMRKESSLFSDRAGVGKTSNTSDLSTLGQSHYKEELVSKFCNNIADHLSTLASCGELKSLTVISEPSFLGEFRKKTPTTLRPLIIKELSKNFYTEKVHELKGFLEDHDIKRY